MSAGVRTVHLARTTLEEICCSASDDYLDLAFLAGVVHKVVPQGPDETRALTLDLLRQCLTTGLLMAGDLSAEGFSPWPNTPEESFARVEAAWMSRPALLSGDDIDLAWFAATPAGLAIAHDVFRREEG